mmetsp:Transcript_13557/g.40183  ORF Transcript_13557/g.40183 Transcript_13557/m.40183 type:complete len:244 (+) Transcript_13557:601-1332(+)
MPLPGPPALKLSPPPNSVCSSAVVMASSCFQPTVFQAKATLTNPLSFISWCTSRSACPGANSLSGRGGGAGPVGSFASTYFCASSTRRPCSTPAPLTTRRSGWKNSARCACRSAAVRPAMSMSSVTRMGRPRGCPGHAAACVASTMCISMGMSLACRLITYLPCSRSSSAYVEFSRQSPSSAMPSSRLRLSASRMKEQWSRWQSALSMPPMASTSSMRSRLCRVGVDVNAIISSRCTAPGRRS